MSNPTRTFINDKLGGTEAVAERLRLTEGAVRMWAHRLRLPRAVWPEILSNYESITLGDLRALEMSEADTRKEAAARKAQAA